MPELLVARLAVVARSAEMQCDEIVALVLSDAGLVGVTGSLLVAPVALLVLAFRRV